jgi:hypothetical protein
MAVYFAVFDRQASGPKYPPEQTWESAKLLGSQSTAPLASDHMQTAKVVRLEAASVAEAQAAVGHFFAGCVNGTPVIVTEAQFKEA